METIGKFSFVETQINGVIIIEPQLHEDERGYFMEAFHYETFQEMGIDMNIMQVNMSKSKQGVLRGLHYQKKYPQAKLVRVIKGEIFDVAVDLRNDSTTHGKWVGVKLSKDNNRQLYIPRGCAHGFLVLSEEAEFLYLVDDIYHPEDEGGIIWNDPEIDIKWPMMGIKELSLSDKDKGLLSLQNNKI